jgi:hypothetical protein
MEPKMWGVLIRGMKNDVHACRDKEIAEAVALLLNRQAERLGMDGYSAEVVLWPRSRSAWNDSCEAFRLEVHAL